MSDKLRKAMDDHGAEPLAGSGFEDELPEPNPGVDLGNDGTHCLHLPGTGAAVLTRRRSLAGLFRVIMTPATRPRTPPITALIICHRMSLPVAYRITSGICTMA
jgi:hypothetical protein